MYGGDFKVGKVNFSLEGKVALVTGAAYGVGFSIAEAYAKAGARIAFNCRSQKNLEQALADYAALGIEAKGYICDVSDEEAVNAMVAQIEQELGVIDILVNNAGIIKRIPMIEMSAEEFRQVVDIDLTAQFIVAKAVIPGMMKKGHGKIINICYTITILFGRRHAMPLIFSNFAIWLIKQKEISFKDVSNDFTYPAAFCIVPDILFKIVLNAVYLIVLKNGKNVLTNDKKCATIINCIIIARIVF